VKYRADQPLTVENDGDNPHGFLGIVHSMAKAVNGGGKELQLPEEIRGTGHVRIAAEIQDQDHHAKPEEHADSGG